MILYYLILFLAALIFSSQFLVTEIYRKYKGTTIYGTLLLTTQAYLVIAVFFFAKAWITNGEITFGYSTFTLLVTLGVAVVSVSCVCMGLKVLSVANMTVYSMFMMLGSLILPTLVGLIFYHEQFTLLKGVAIAMMIASIVLSVGGINKKSSAKVWIYYIGIFILNGMIGVLFSIHQNNPELTAFPIISDGIVKSDNDVFMCWYGLSTAALSFIALMTVKLFMVIGNKKSASASGIGSSISETAATLEKGSGASATISKGMAAFVLVIPAIYGLFNGLGDYFIAVATSPSALGSSVTYPIINGGTILFSSLIGMFVLKEKITVKTIVSLALVMVSTVLFMMACGV